MALSIVCPVCGNDMNQPLNGFVRFYDGDEGWGECEACEVRVHWSMALKVENIATVA